MKQPTSINTDSSLQKAQDATIQSIAKFEDALEHLAEKVENTNQRVEHVGEIVQRLKGDFFHIKDSAKHAVEPLMPLVSQGKDISGRAFGKVRQNPRAFVAVVAGLAGVYWAFKSFRSPASSAYISDTEY